jgi:hypothetical protein
VNREYLPLGANFTPEIQNSPVARISAIARVRFKKLPSEKHALEMLNKDKKEKP